MSTSCYARSSLRAAVRRLANLEASALLNLFPEVFRSESLGLDSVRLRIYTPLVTLALAVWQQLWRAAACREAVLYLTALRAAQGLAPPSACTAGFCRAKKRLPLQLLESSIRSTAAAAVKGVPEYEYWLGHRVNLLDGTTFSMPDTDENQERWPQPPTQDPAQGFPQMRLVGLFSLCTGAVLDWAEGRYLDGEATLARQLFAKLEANDIIVRDRGFAGYAFMAELYMRQVHTITRLPAKVTKYTEVHRLGDGDVLVRLFRSRQPSKGYTPEQWQQLPKSMVLRFIKVQVDTPGFRTRSYTLVTTLLDDKKYPSQALAALYRARWEVEVDFLRIKEVMGAEVLRSRRPEMIRREILYMLLAYNIVRATMAQVACLGKLDPRRISFAGALAALRQINATLGGLTQRARKIVMRAVLGALASQPVAHRPNRAEPRAIKRRYKDYPRLRGSGRQVRCQSRRNHAYAKAKKERGKAAKAGA